MTTTELPRVNEAPVPGRAPSRVPRAGLQVTGQMYEEIRSIVRQKLSLSMRRWPSLRAAADEFEDAVAVGVAAIWEALVEDDLDWDSLGRIERLELATPAQMHLQKVVRGRRTSRQDAAKEGRFTNRYVYDTFAKNLPEGDSESWFDSSRFASQSAEDIALADEYEGRELTADVVNEMFGTPGLTWSQRQLDVLEALAYHRGTTVDMGRTLFSDLGGKSSPENVFTSTQQQIKQKIVRHQEANA